jgi:multiple sugar transport system substrate-binding protein
MKLATRLLGAGALIGLTLPMSAAVHTSYAAQSGACPQSQRIGLNVSGWSGADQEADMVQHELKLFEQANPCVTTYFSPIPSNYQQKIQAEFASGAEPDVMYISPDMIANEGKAGKLLDLTPYLKADGVNTGAYIPSLLKVFQLNGKTYGLPKDWGTLGIFYNKAIFDAKHIPYPSNNLTYAQFEALAQKLYTPSSNPAKVIYGTMTPEDIDRAGVFVYGYGSSIQNPDTGQVLFNNSKTVQAISFYTGLTTKDKVATIPQTVGDGWQGDSFGKGRVAMVLEGGWLTPYLRSTYPKINFGVAEIPIGPAGRTDMEFTNAWGVSADTVKNHTDKAAVKLVEFLTGQQTQTYQTEIGFSLPTLQSLQNLSYLKTHPESENLFAAYPYLKTGNFGAYDSRTTTALDNAITAILLGKQTPSQAVTSAAQTLQSQITAVP